MAMDRYFFVGIGGTGMSRLALLMKQFGIEVSGSDRCYPSQCTHPLLARLREENITIVPQDGSGLSGEITKVVVSAAIEKDNPDIITAQSLSIPVQTRSQVLADIFNRNYGLGITGTSGKTTTTGMISTVLRHIQVPHLYYCGEDLSDPLTPAPVAGEGSSVPMVAEIDESDSSPVFYHASRGLITNVSLDHQHTSHIMDILEKFCHNSDTVILNADCPYCTDLRNRVANRSVVTFGICNPADIFAGDIKLSADGVRFMCMGMQFKLQVAGRHNVYNALGAIAMLLSMNIDPYLISCGLGKFKGIKRRLELISHQSGVRVYDDFSHNPDKIFAALTTLKQVSRRIFLIFRPHGYGPMKLFRAELIDSISTVLTQSDRIYFLDIFDAGGTADRTIHSEDLINDLKRKNMNAMYVNDPENIAGLITEAELKEGDTVVVMGARDPYLGTFARSLSSKIMTVFKEGVVK